MVHQLDKAIVEREHFKTMKDNDGKGGYAAETIKDLIVGLGLQVEGGVGLFMCR